MPSPGTVWLSPWSRSTLSVSSGASPDRPSWPPLGPMACCSPPSGPPLCHPGPADDLLSDPGAPIRLYRRHRERGRRSRLEQPDHDAQRRRAGARRAMGDAARHDMTAPDMAGMLDRTAAEWTEDTGPLPALVPVGPRTCGRCAVVGAMTRPYRRISWRRRPTPLPFVSPEGGAGHGAVKAAAPRRLAADRCDGPPLTAALRRVRRSLERGRVIQAGLRLQPAA